MPKLLGNPVWNSLSAKIYRVLETNPKRNQFELLMFRLFCIPTPCLCLFCFHFGDLLFLNLQQLLAERDGDGLGAVGGAEFVIKRVDMLFDTGLADVQL